MADTETLFGTSVVLRESEASRIDMLRLRKPSAQTLEHIGRLLGVSLPTEPNHAAGATPRAIWMGPDEWMLVEPTVAPSEFEAAPGAAAILVVQVGDGRYALDVEGTSAEDFLAKAVSIDLHRREFAVNRSAMTLFAQVPVVIDRVGANRFRLWFDVSLRDYVRKWCEDALVEFSP